MTKRKKRRNARRLLRKTSELGRARKAQAAFRDSVPATLDALRSTIADAVPKAQAVVERVNPILLIHALFMQNSLVDPEAYCEPAHTGSEALAEYAQSLVTASSAWGSAIPTRDDHEMFESAVEAIVDATRDYFFLKTAASEGLHSENETKFLGMIEHLFIRGPGMYEHTRELFASLFAPHDEVLKSTCGICSGDLLRVEDALTMQVNSAANASLEAGRLTKRIHREFCDAIDSGVDPEEAVRAARESDDTRRAVEANRASMDGPRVTSLGDAGMFENIALSAGDNTDFMFEKSPAWPSNDSEIYAKPLMRIDDDFYCPNPVLMARSRYRVLEAALRAKNPGYYRNQFARARGRLLEDLAAKHFRKLLPDAEVYENVYYWLEEQGGRRRCEADVVIVYGEYLFLVEAKAAPFSPSSLRGAPKQLKKDVRELIDGPFQQSERTRRFIEAPGISQFEDGSGAPLFEIADTRCFRRTYCIGVTLAHLGYITTRLHSVKEAGLLEGPSWHWSVFINDLRVMSELIESPAEFILYLERRKVLDDNPVIGTIDELDYLGMFFLEGL